MFPVYSCFQWEWISGQTLGKSLWTSRNSFVKKLKYSTDTLQVYTVLHNTTQQTIAAYSGDINARSQKITTPMLSVGREWAQVIHDMVHIPHPVPGRNCTLCLLNPLTGSLEWMSVDCHKKYSIATLVCQKNTAEALDSIDLLYVDLTSYIEHHEGSFKDSRLLYSCPYQVYIHFCSHGGFSLRQVYSFRAHKAHEMPKTHVSTLRILQYTRSHGQSHYLDVSFKITPVLSHLFEHMCINKSYFFLNYGNRPTYKFGYDSSMYYNYGHFSLCPIRLTKLRSKPYHLEISIKVISMTLYMGMIFCSRNCFALKHYCVCSGFAVSDVNIANDEQTVSFFMNRLQIHGLCVNFVDTKVQHYDCRTRLTSEGLYHAWSIVHPKSPTNTSTHHLFKCPFGLFQCKDAHCVSPLVINDHNSDCPDGTDEIGMCGSSNDCDVCKLPDCVCSSNLYQCAQGGCILWDRVGNGQQDCKFGEDELVFAEINNPRYRPLPCSVYDISPCVNYTNYQPFLCYKTNVSIPGEWVNDLIPDCPMSDDEPPQTEYIVNDCYPLLQCTPGHPRCFPVYGLCVYNHDKHGHLSYCRNGAHLGDCQLFACSGYFKCPSSYCLPVWKICDNVTDCGDGEDEEGCVAEQELSCPGFLRCKGGGCVHPLQVCDGQVDCQISQEDEYGCDNALCPEFCDCLGATITCYDNITLDLRNYKALFRVNTAAHAVNINHGRSLYMLNNSKNRLGDIDSTTFKDLSSLVFLDISSNRIRHIAKDSFIAQTHLILLDIKDNHINVVEIMAFAGLQSITVLDLSMQNISKVDGIFCNRSSTIKLYNVSSNYIEFLSIPAMGDLSKLVTLDIRNNPITRVNITDDYNVANLIILTDISYLCCFNETYTVSCEKKTWLGVCPHSRRVDGVSCYVISAIILNILLYVRKRNSYKVRTSIVLFSLQVLCNSLMGISVLLPLLKDILFLPEIVNHQQGGKYMYCLVSGTFQLFLLLFLSRLAVFKSVNTYRGTHRIIKESSSQRYKFFIMLVIIWLVDMFMSITPSLVSLFTYGFLPNLSRLCSLFNDLNNDSLGTTVSIVFILCLIILNSLVQIMVSFGTLKTIYDSQKAVQRMGGKISSGKRKSVMIFKCLIQPITLAFLQSIVSIVCILAIAGIVADMDELVRDIITLLPCIIQPILENIK